MTTTLTYIKVKESEFISVSALQQLSTYKSIRGFWEIDLPKRIAIHSKHNFTNMSQINYNC